MKRMLLAAATVCFSALGAQAATPVAATAAEESSILSGLEIGTRIIHVELREDEKGVGTSTRSDNFLGSIDMLDAEQDYAPTRLYAQYFFCDLLGVGISYDKVEADAGDEGGSDGIVGMDGPIVYAVARYHTETSFTPFLELGVAFYNPYFDESESWADDGDYRRYMEVENTEALVIGLGCDYSFTDNLSMNLYARMVDGATIDAQHFNSESPSRPRQTGDFNLDYFGLGIGIKYAFQ